MDKKLVYATKSQLHEELDQALELRADLKAMDFDAMLGELTTTETRIKILKEFIRLFKVAQQTPQPCTADVAKRCRLHLKQLKKLNSMHHDANVAFFVCMFKILRA